MTQLLSSAIFSLEDSSMANDIIQMPEGDYIIVGRIYNTDKGDSGFALRITSSGSIIWEKIYSAPFSQFFEKVTLLADGSYIATGSYFYSIYSGDEYIWVINFDKEGNIIWQKAFGEVGIQSDGYDVKATKDGGFIVTGLSSEESTLTWILKFDSKGTLQWDKKFDVGLAFSITQTMDEGYALIGSHSLEDSLNSNPFILRLNTQGDKVWGKIYDDYEIYVLINGDIIETSNGHFVAASKTLLMEVDSSGNIVWSIENESLRLTSILQMSDGNYGVSGGLVDINYLEHAYIATLNKQALINVNSSEKKIIWDNVDIKYNSGYKGIIEDKFGLIVGCGFMSRTVNNLDSFFTVFDLTANVI